MSLLVLLVAFRHSLIHALLKTDNKWPVPVAVDVPYLCKIRNTIRYEVTVSADQRKTVVNAVELAVIRKWVT